MTRESEVTARTLLDVGTLPGVRLFRNSVGLGWQGVRPRQQGGVLILEAPRPVRFGLHVGSPDYVGWQTVRVTPDMVGQDLAVMLGLEFKTPTGRASKDQRTFLAAMQAAGARAGLIRSPADARALLKV